jgi:DNA-binding transcriptional LysR family regulator
MRFNQLDLNLLVALDVLISERNVTRAAAQLHLSQSATSSAMSRLREYFEDELLVQVGRTMVPTPLAESLAGPVRDVLLQIRSTIETKPGFDPLTSDRHFRVVASDYVATVLMARCARELRLRAPHITLELVPPSAAAFAQLDRAEIDLLTVPDRYQVPGHASEELFLDSYTCVVDRHNSAVGERLTMEQYLALGHVAISFGPGQSSVEESYLRGMGLARRVEVTTATFNTLPQFVMATDRVATMHLRLARECVSYFPLRIVAPPEGFPPLAMHMQWHKSMEKDLSHVWLRALLHEVAAPG